MTIASVATLATAVLSGCGGGDDEARKRPEPAGRVVVAIKLGAEPAHLAFGLGALWVTTYFDNRVYRIDPETNTVVATINAGPPGQETRWMAVGEGAVWVTDFDGDVVRRIDPSTNRVTETIPVGDSPTGVGAWGGAVWVSNHHAGSFTRIDPQTNKVVATIKLGPGGRGGPQAIAFAAGSVWVTIPNLGRIARIDPRRNALLPDLDAPGCSSIAAADEAVWADDGCEPQRLVRVSTRSNQVAASLPAGGLLRGVAASSGSVWITTQGARVILKRIDSRTNRVVARLDIAQSSRGNRLALGAGDVWVGGLDRVYRIRPRKM